MIDMSWMAWTPPTGLFFALIGLTLLLMARLHFMRPGGDQARPGLLFGLATTRGDRLFIVLLGSAYIHLAWLALTDYALPWAGALSIVYAAVIFRWG